MKAYETLELEVIKFEAQDVITASVEAPVEEEAYKCFCDEVGCTGPQEIKLESGVEIWHGTQIEKHFCSDPNHTCGNG